MKQEKMNLTSLTQVWFYFTDIRLSEHLEDSENNLWHGKHDVDESGNPEKDRKCHLLWWYMHGIHIAIAFCHHSHKLLVVDSPILIDSHSTSDHISSP